jgi:predicted NBD/HSP70 family sugar kinase
MESVLAKGFRYPNQSVIFRQIRYAGSLTRRRLTQLTDLSFQTVSNIVADLVDMELVVSDGLVNQNAGKPAESLKVNPEGLYAVGILLDRGKFEATLIDLSGQCVLRSTHAISSVQPEETLLQIAEVTQQFLKRTGVPPERFAGVGIASPGPIDFRFGAISHPPNFPGWAFVPLQQQLTDMLGCSVTLIKDSHAAALAEVWSLHTGVPSSMFYLYLSAGIGGSFVIDSRIWTGFLGNAGEVGHIVVADGPLCECGRQGCLEAAWSLGKIAREAGKTVEEFADLLNQKTLPYWDHWRQGIPLLARAVVDVVNVLEPESLIVGGPQGEIIGNDLVTPLTNALQKEGFVHNLRPIVVRTAAVANAASMGAGLVQINAALTSDISSNGVLGLAI